MSETTPQQPTPVDQLPEIAKEVRKEVIEMLTLSKSGHPGGSLSETDIVTALYFHLMNHDPKNPAWEDRDRFILSKGHGVPAVYAAMALSGYFDKSELSTLRQINSRLQGHPDMSRLPGIEACTGSLGQGLSVCAGIALAAKMDKKDFWTYCLLSDGETQEGQTWEAAAFAGFHELDNLIVILDYNKYQLDGAIAEILGMEPYTEKWASFRWEVQEIDGHDINQVIDAVNKAKSVKGKPHLIIANTVKGKGVSFMESNNYFHGVAPTAEEREAALAEIDGDPSLSEALLAAGKVKQGAK